MSDISIPVRKFHRLFDYLERIGLDASKIARQANLNFHSISELPPEQMLPGVYYSTLYKEAVEQMQRLDNHLPWAAGLGSDAFEMMCHCIITCKTLKEALNRAEKFNKLLYPVIGHAITLTTENNYAKLQYDVTIKPVDKIFTPANWDRRIYSETVSKASGLLVWYAFCSWLIGRSIDLGAVKISAPFLSDAYHEGLMKTLQCSISYDENQSVLLFSEEQLDYRLVHTPDSLQDFLHNSIYQLITMENKPASTSAAIKSLIGKDFKEGMPSFSDIADSLHMSESSLRRRLIKEDVSYQALKDQVRCETAIEYLRRDDLKVQDLSDLLGFTEPSSFVRSFRSWTGMTPKMYREKMSTLGGDSS
jgi:AraC-like DNA-binding protein